MAPAAILAAAARNMAAWHTACLAALRVESRIRAATWVCERPAPFIYLSAITLAAAYRAGEHYEAIAELAGQRQDTFAVSDTWSTLDPRLMGFSVFDRPAWYVREPAPASPAAGLPPVERVTTAEALAAFERAQHLGFGSPELLELGPGGVYGPGLLGEETMFIYLAREPGGEVVAGATACVAAGLVGVYSVTTLPGYRRQGYGEAVTRAAMASAPGLPVVLQPSEMGRSLYERLGFREAGIATTWIRRA